MARTHVAPIRCERFSVERLQLVVRETNHVECAIDLEGGEVVGEVELVSCVGRVENDVKLEGVRLVPFVVVAADEFLGAELESIVFLGG